MPLVIGQGAGAVTSVSGDREREMASEKKDGERDRRKRVGIEGGSLINRVLVRYPVNTSTHL